MTEPKVHTIEELLAELRSWRPSVRARAAAALRARGAEVVTPLMTFLDRSRMSRRRVRPLFKVFQVGYCGLALYWLHVGDPSWWLLAALLVLIAIIGWVWRISAAEVECLRIVADTEDPRALGPLVDAISYGDPWGSNKINDLARGALTKLLRQLTPEGAELLDDRSRRLLIGMVSWTQAAAYPSLAVSILRAWEQVGGNVELRRVERAAAAAISHRNRRVVEEARRVLPAMRTRLLEARTQGALLRAASAPDDPSNTLVRPASDTHSEAERLLRPIQ